MGLNGQLEKVHKREAKFVTRNYNYETRSMTGILGALKLEPFQKTRKDNRFILLYIKLEYIQMTISQRIYVAEVNALWHV